METTTKAQKRRKTSTVMMCVAVIATLFSTSGCSAFQGPSNQEVKTLVSELEKRGFDDPVVIGDSSPNVRFGATLGHCRITLRWNSMSKQFETDGREYRYYSGDAINAPVLLKSKDFSGCR